MKNLLLSLFMILFCVSAYSQNYFTLTPNGYRNLSDQNKNYIVHKFTNISKEEISKRVVQWICYSLNNYEPNIELFSKDNHTILLKKSIEYFILFGYTYMTLDYEISFFITDNAIRINAPSSYLSGVTPAIGRPYNGTKSYLGIKGKNKGDFSYIYDANDKLILSEHKTKLEDYFNSLCTKIIEAISTDTNSKWETEQ